MDPGFTGSGSAGRRDRREPLAGSSHPARRGRALAPHPVLDTLEGPGLRPKTTRIIGLYTHPPDDATVICADELGSAIPRAFPPAPAWSPDGHRIKAELDYSRGPEKTWVYGGLRPADGQAVTMTASSRNSVFYQQFLQQLEDANPGLGDLDRHRQPVQSQQTVHPGLARGPSRNRNRSCRARCSRSSVRHRLARRTRRADQEPLGRFAGYGSLRSRLPGGLQEPQLLKQAALTGPLQTFRLGPVHESRRSAGRPQPWPPQPSRTRQPRTWSRSHQSSTRIP